MKNIWLVHQAKSFYNAYIALEQIGDPVDSPMLLLVPRLVNGAFAVEVTLKAILTEQGIDYAKEHNIKVLFDLLPKDIQNDFWDFLTSKKPEYADTQKREKELVIMSDAFVKWRYCFESNNPPAFDSNFLSAFANAAIYMMFHLGYNVSFQPVDLPESEEDIEKKYENNRNTNYQSSINYINRKQNGGTA